MALAAGICLGSYEIVGALGAGGMGEVYRARDTKLGRDVAIKVLPESFADDPERLARFEREAKLLASLNHPHIATIYGLEESGGAHRARDGAGRGRDAGRSHRSAAPLPLDEALPIARQIAEALEAAHEQGHHPSRSEARQHQGRPDGTVKVLDFGLAKAIDAGAAAGDVVEVADDDARRRRRRA